MHLQSEQTEMLPEEECGSGDVDQPQQRGRGMCVCPAPPHPLQDITASLTSSLEGNTSEE